MGAGLFARSGAARVPLGCRSGEDGVMSYVAINILTVPEGRGEVLEQRFAGRAGAVDTAAGFEHFELLRPVEGTQDYLVYTRWRSKADFEAWTASQSFERGHAQARRDDGPPAPAATGSQVWGFEVVRSDGAADTPAT
jgi:heme-degrading monooxygenase HmoA